MIKFPKEEAIIFREINQALECEDYDVIYRFKDKVIDSYEVFKNSDIYIALIKAMFYKGKYESVVSLVTSLQQKEYEKLEIYFYLLCSCLALEDIYQAASVVRKSSILNSNEVKMYWDEEATYSSILNCDKKVKKTYVMLRFMRELLKEISMNDNLEDGYVGIRYFELVNTLWEIGYEEAFVKELIEIANEIFVKE